MSNKLKELRAKEGFTIIEVIIVLVIGAVIMLAVFLVVPQLQRTQRNTRAQNDARRILTAGEQFASSNNGTYPKCANDLTLDATTGAGVCTDITAITGQIKSPTNNTYTTKTAAPGTNQVYIGPGACPTATGTVTYSPTSTDNSLIVVVSQEPTGTWCIAKQ